MVPALKCASPVKDYNQEIGLSQDGSTQVYPFAPAGQQRTPYDNSSFLEEGAQVTRPKSPTQTSKIRGKKI